MANLNYDLLALKTKKGSHISKGKEAELDHTPFSCPNGSSKIFVHNSKNESLV
jgi:hypothetical protein